MAKRKKARKLTGEEAAEAARKLREGDPVADIDYPDVEQFSFGPNGEFPRAFPEEMYSDVGFGMSSHEYVTASRKKSLTEEQVKNGWYFSPSLDGKLIHKSDPQYQIDSANKKKPTKGSKPKAEPTQSSPDVPNVVAPPAKKPVSPETNARVRAALEASAASRGVGPQPGTPNQRNLERYGSTKGSLKESLARLNELRARIDSEIDSEFFKNRLPVELQNQLLDPKNPKYKEAVAAFQAIVDEQEKGQYGPLKKPLKEYVNLLGTVSRQFQTVKKHHPLHLRNKIEESVVKGRQNARSQDVARRESAQIRLPSGRVVSAKMIRTRVNQIKGKEAAAVKKFGGPLQNNLYGNVENVKRAFKSGYAGNGGPLMGLAALAAGTGVGMVAKHFGEVRDENKLRLQNVQQQAQRDSLTLMQNQGMKAHLQNSISQNLMRLQSESPELYARVSAGRVLPQGAVVIGGTPRQDLLQQLGMSMSNNEFVE